MLRYIQETSDCWGFEGQISRTAEENAEYCAAEVLFWNYLEETRVIELIDHRALLNCCGVKAVVAANISGEYVVRQVQSAGDCGQCACMCAFDFSVAIENVEVGLITLRLTRDIIQPVLDSTEGVYEFEWSGNLDLSEGSGSVVLDTRGADICR